MKTGRPPVENPKNVKYSIRLDEQTEQELTAYCKRSGITKGEAIRTAIKALLMNVSTDCKDPGEKGGASE